MHCFIQHSGYVINRYKHKIHLNFVICAFAEVHDDVEATTNEIKKAANNARNKLKSETSAIFSKLRIISAFLFDREHNKKCQINVINNTLECSN